MNNVQYVSRSGNKTKGDYIAIIDIKSQDKNFRRIRAGGANSKGKKYIALIYEIEGEDYLNER